MRASSSVVTSRSWVPGSALAIAVKTTPPGATASDTRRSDTRSAPTQSRAASRWAESTGSAIGQSSTSSRWWERARW